MLAMALLGFRTEQVQETHKRFRTGSSGCMITCYHMNKHSVLNRTQ